MTNNNEHEMPLLGWRAWNFDEGSNLSSTITNTHWDPTLDAHCHFSRHKAPQKNCTCGLYMVLSETDDQLAPEWFRKSNGGDFAFGVGCLHGLVAITGRSFVYPNGVIRAERARIICFIRPKGMNDWMAGQLESKWEAPLFKRLEGDSMMAYATDRGEWWPEKHARLKTEQPPEDDKNLWNKLWRR